MSCVLHYLPKNSRRRIVAHIKTNPEPSLEQFYGQMLSVASVEQDSGVLVRLDDQCHVDAVDGEQGVQLDVGSVVHELDWDQILASLAWLVINIIFKTDIQL